MNDPEIHSTEWEWDTTSPSVHWKKSHNFIHHKYTNVVGLDDDIGYGIMRLTRDQRWERWMIGNPVYNLHARNAVRVGRRAARGGDHEVPQGREVDGRGQEGPADHRQEDRQAGRQGLHRFPRAHREELEAHVGRQRGGEPDPQLLVVHGDLLRPLPRRRREVHPRGVRERDSGRMVSAADVRLGQLSCRSGDGVHERQPVLPDRAPPVPRLAEQPIRRNQRARPGAVRQVRPALHDRIPWPAVLAVVLDDPQARAAQQASQGDVR